MKALREAKELLIDVKIDVEKEGVEQFGYIETKLEIIIAELEALQQPKSCDGCVHLDRGRFCTLPASNHCIRDAEDYFKPKDK